MFAGCGAIVANAQYDAAPGAVGVSLVFGLIIMAMIYATGASMYPARSVGPALAAGELVRGDQPGPRPLEGRA